MLSRREFLKKSLRGASIVAMPAIMQSVFQACMGSMQESSTQIKVREGRFNNALPVPSVVNAAGSVTLRAAENVSQIIPGKKTRVYGYAGSILGPTLQANDGQAVSIQFDNNLYEPTNIHWHGLIVPQNMDGLPFNLIAPGSSFRYQFTISQRAGTYWYHPHPDGRTASQVFYGLAGFFIVRDTVENALNLPSGAYEIPIVIQDKRIAPDYSLEYGPSMMEFMGGYLGQYILLNGQYSNYLNAATRWYRLRLLNGSTARAYNLKFSNGMTFQLIGSDGGLLAAPNALTSILLAPGERADILVNLSGLSVGSEIFLLSDTFSEGGEFQGYESFRILRIFIDRNEADGFLLPGTLSTIPAANTGTAVATRTFNIKQNDMMSGGGMNMKHTINGKSFEMARIDATVNANTSEVWTIDNTGSTEIHPIHIHGVQFRVVSRTGGRGQIQAWETGYKDTVLVTGNEKVQLLVQFPAHRGKFVFHCHNLEHEDTGMMSNFEVV